MKNENEVESQTEAVAKACNEELRSKLADYRSRHELSLSMLAKHLATNATQLSRYLAGKPQGDVPKLERVIEDVLLSEKRRAAAGHEIAETSVAKSVALVLDLVRESNDVALLHGAAGLGKTCALALYASRNPSVVAVCASSERNNAQAVKRMISSQISMRGWERSGMSRGDWIIQQLRGSNRLLVVDNAHRLTVTGLAWVFDFHDDTGCPVALVGNPAVLSLIKASDQMYSRVGLCREISMGKGRARDLARAALAAMGEDPAEVEDIAEVVAENSGHLRAVRKHCVLARKLQRGDGGLSAADAWRQAHHLLVHDYSL